MRFFKYFIRPYMYVQYHFQKATGRGGFGKDQGVYIKEKYEATGNAVKDGLFKHHVKQFHESSCSVASVASMVNSLLEKQGMLNGHPVTQHELLDNVKAAHWKERMSADGYKGRRGLPLDILGQVVEDSLDTYKIKYKSVETVQVTRDPVKSTAVKALLQSRLELFEKEGTCLLIAHFDQGSFMPEMHIPHISPVGGIDPVSGKITLLDVDFTQDYPYEMSFDTFYKGLAYNYNHVFRKYGFAEGGYIFIQI